MKNIFLAEATTVKAAPPRKVALKRTARREAPMCFVAKLFVALIYCYG
jgi:hypothetical protein